MYKYYLSDVEWREFFVNELFYIRERGRRLKNDDRESGKVPLITAGESNNGVSSFVKNKRHKEYNNAITIDMFGNAFFQKGRFKCDDNITVLKNNNFSEQVYLFLTSRLNILSDKYSYGKQLRPNRLTRDKIMLPVDSAGNPNWHFMEEYIKEREEKQRQKIVAYYKEKLRKLAVGWGGGHDRLFVIMWSGESSLLERSFKHTQEQMEHKLQREVILKKISSRNLAYLE